MGLDGRVIGESGLTGMRTASFDNGVKEGDGGSWVVDVVVVVVGRGWTAS